MSGVELQQKIEAAIRESLERTFGSLRDEVSRRLRVSQDDVLGYLTTVDVSATLPTLPAELLEPPPPDRAPALLADLTDGVRRLDAGRTQAAILRSLLAASGRHASRTAIFLANKDGVRLWESEGFSRAPRISAIPSGEIAAFDEARSGRGSVRLSADAARAVGERIGAEPAREAVLIPLVLRDQIASFLYADQVQESDDFAPEALQLLTYVAALSLETLAFRKRERTPTLVPLGERAAQGLTLWETAGARPQPAAAASTGVATPLAPVAQPAPAPTPPSIAEKPSVMLEPPSPRTSPIPLTPAIPPAPIAPPAPPAPTPPIAPLASSTPSPSLPPSRATAAIPSQPLAPTEPAAPLAPTAPIAPTAPKPSSGRLPTGTWTVIEPTAPAAPATPEPPAPRFSFDAWNVSQPAPTSETERKPAVTSSGSGLPPLASTAASATAAPKVPSSTPPPTPPAPPTAPALITPLPPMPRLGTESPSFDESLPSLGEGFGTVRIPRAADLFRNVREPEAAPAGAGATPSATPITAPLKMPAVPLPATPTAASTAKVETTPPPRPFSGATTANLDVSEDETVLLPGRTPRSPEPLAPPPMPPLAPLAPPPSVAPPARDEARRQTAPFALPDLSASATSSPVAPTTPPAAPRPPVADLSLPPSAATQRIPSFAAPPAPPPSAPRASEPAALPSGPIKPPVGGATAEVPRSRPASPSEVVPPDNLRGPGLAFAGARASGESPAHDEARRLARLLVSEIKLYNEEQVDLGRKNLDLYQRLREDIDRSRQMYDDRVDAGVRSGSDYFQQELVRILAGGDPKALGT